MSEVGRLCCMPCREFDGGDTRVAVIDGAGHGRCNVHARMSPAQIAQEKREGVRWGFGRVMLARIGGRGVLN
jgi:hypothetical protein